MSIHTQSYVSEVLERLQFFHFVSVIGHIQGLSKVAPVSQLFTWLFTRVQVVPISNHDFKKYFPTDFDDDCCVVLSEDFQSPTVDGDTRWIILQSRLKPQKLVKAKFSKKIEKRTCLVQATLYRNLFGENPITMQLSPSKNNRISFMPFICDTSTLPHVPWASEAHISVVKTAFSENVSSYVIDNALKMHFSSPRSVSEGDLFIADTSKCQKLSHSRFSMRKLPKNKWLCFKINRLSHSKTLEEDGKCGSLCFLMDADHTSLYLKDSYLGLLPDVTLIDSLRNKMAPGFDDLLLDLAEIMYPYIKAPARASWVPPYILLKGPPFSGKKTLVQYCAYKLGFNLLELEGSSLMGETSAAAEARIKIELEKARTMAPCIIYIKRIDMLGKEKDGSTEDSRVIKYFSETFSSQVTSLKLPLILIGASSAPKLKFKELSNLFVHGVTIKPLTIATRQAVFEWLQECGEVPLDTDIDVMSVANATAGYSIGNLVTLFNNATRYACKRLENEDDGKHCITEQDLNEAIEKMRKQEGKVLGIAEIPKVQWDDVGGLEEAKREIFNTIQLPLLHPDTFPPEMRRSGILLWGPPGTGKTLLAKAVATELSLRFISVSGPELINSYVGQSEENVRNVFTSASSVAPCIIFFDEIDALAPNRGRSGDSGGVMDRIVSQLLAELDRVASGKDVFVIGATNRPDLIDTALLRPGRFDKQVYIPIASSTEAKLKILEALTRRLPLSSDVDLQYVAEYCTGVMSGADLYSLIADALVLALSRVVDSRQRGKCEEELLVCKDDFLNSAENLTSSVSADELKRYKALAKSISRR